jgi:tyrosine-protein kinase Etk/Wzc
MVPKERDHTAALERLRFAQRMQSAEDSSLNIMQLWKTILNGKWVVLLTTVVVVVAMAAYTVNQDRVYSAESLVLVELQQQPSPIAFVEQRKLPSEVGILQNSVELAERVAERLRETAEAVGSAQQFPSLYDEAGVSIPTQRVATRLLRQVRFTPITAQDMISLAAESTSPEEAATIANLYVEEYKDYSQEQSRASISAQRVFLEKQVDERRTELEQFENEWVRSVLRQGTYSQGKDADLLLAEFTAVNSKLKEAQIQLQKQQYQLDILNRQLRQVEPELLTRWQQESAASQIKTEIEAFDEQISQLRMEEQLVYLEHPGLEGNEQRIRREYAPLAQKIDNIKALEEARAKRVNDYYQERQYATSDIEGGGELARVATLRNRILEQELVVGGLNEEVGAIDRYLDSYMVRLQNLPRQSVEQNQFERKQTQLEQQYAQFVAELQKARVSEEAELGYIRIVRSAFVPTLPVRPNMQQNLLLAILVGLGLGIGLAFVKEAINNRFNKPEDLRAQGYTPVGVIPRMDEDVKAIFGKKESIEVGGQQLSTRLLTLHDPWSHISENFRLIRNNLTFVRHDTPNQVLLMTSPEAADGKTLTAMNLAITIAQSGSRTLFIDADMRRPSGHKLLGVDRTPGLAEILSQQIAFSPDRFTTLVDNLTFIPAGDVKVPPPELLGGKIMRDLLDRLRKLYDVIIIDSPPVLAVTDAVVLASLTDSIAIVVSADKTNQRALEVTEETLSSVGTPILGTIFNRFDQRKGGSYYASYGYYGYGEEKVVTK